MIERVYLKAAAEQCTMCGRCMLACAWKHFGELCTGKAALRMVHQLPQNYKVQIRSCNQCVREYCVKVCPTGALYRDEKGYVALDREKCHGCENSFPCVAACKAGLIFLHPEVPYPLKCDLCEGEPACIQECLPGVLYMAGKERR